MDGTRKLDAASNFLGVFGRKKGTEERWCYMLCVVE